MLIASLQRSEPATAAFEGDEGAPGLGANRRSRLATAAAAVGALSFACVLLTTLFADHYDDAYITYVFARNWAAGHGIAWVAGDRPLFAATSITYTAVLALARAWASTSGDQRSSRRPSVGVRPTCYSWCFSTAGLGLRVPSAPACSPRSRHCRRRLSMGMESGVLAALVLLALALQQEGKRTAAGVVATLAALTRPEGLLLFPLLAAHGLLPPGQEGWRERLRRTALALVPGAALLAASLAGLAIYFGSFVPQSLRAKLCFTCASRGDSPCARSPTC